MPRVNIYFTIATLKDLTEFVLTKYGKKKALSLTVEEAVKSYLERQKLLEKLSR